MNQLKGISYYRHISISDVCDVIEKNIHSKSSNAVADISNLYCNNGQYIDHCLF